VVAAVSLVVAAFYLLVGARLSSRKVSPTSRLATNQLAMWWGGLGADLTVSSVVLLVALGGGLSFATAMTLYLVTIIVIVAALWGLTGFLVYVYTGRYHLLEVSAIYISFYVLYLYWFFAEGPTQMVIEAGSTVWRFSGSANLPIELVLVILLVGPEIVAAILYLSLRRKTKDSAQKYRITLVGGGILLWFGIDLFLPGDTIPWLIFRTFVAVIPALMSLAAYFPPEWARRRYGATAIELQSSDAPEVATSP
jgi:hypothetical protein